MEENILVLGDGYLGNRISNELGYPLSDFKIKDEDSLWKYLDEKNPKIIINTIAKTGTPNTDWCESHKQETYFSNVSVPVFLKKYCSWKGIYLVHFGTGGIYEGDNQGEGFTELDEPPFVWSQFYIKTKILSEKILGDYDNCLQLRINLPIDDQPHEKNLIDKLKKYNKLVDIPTSITSVPHIFKALEILIEKNATGVYNFVNPGTISALEIMKMYKEIVCPLHEFKEFSLDELNNITKGKRMNCFLNTDKLKKEGIILPEIHSAVEECLRNYKLNLLH